MLREIVQNQYNEAEAVLVSGIGRGLFSGEKLTEFSKTFNELNTVLTNLRVHLVVDSNTESSTKKWGTERYATIALYHKTLIENLKDTYTKFSNQYIEIMVSDEPYAYEVDYLIKSYSDDTE